MLYLFLDTTIYLHYRDIETIDWKKVVDTFDDIAIVVPSITVAEVDEHKNFTQGKVGKRARAVSRKLGDIFLHGKKSKYAMTRCKKPTKQEMSSLNLDDTDNDDVFIASVLLFNRENDKNCIIVAQDNILLLKAQELGIQFRSLPDELLLAEELSDEEKELKALKQELTDIKSAISKPKLKFSNGETILRIKRPEIANIEELVREAVNVERSNNPPLIHKDDIAKGEEPVPLESLLHTRLTAFVYTPTEEEVNTYNSYLDEYFQEFEDKKRDDITKKVFDSYAQKIQFSLHNDGTTPTGELNVCVKFPPNIQLYDHRSKTAIIENAPKKPIRPSWGGLWRSETLAAMIPPLSTAFYLNGPPPRTKRWDFSKVIPEREFWSELSPVTHSMRCAEVLDEPLVINASTCPNFGIEYYIVDAKLPKRIEGTLSVVFE